MIINSDYIHKAMGFYLERGYKLISVPYIVNPEISAITRPTNKKEFKHLDKVYVGSAEQSFLQLYKDGNLEFGKYQALTPCYRDEDKIDKTHFNIFLKLELIEIGNISGAPLKDAKDFFSKITTENIETIKTEEGFDLEIGSTEIGSYGKRTMLDGVEYYYGTGIAEPRLSLALTKGY